MVPVAALMRGQATKWVCWATLRQATERAVHREEDHGDDQQSHTPLDAGESENNRNLWILA